MSDHTIMVIWVMKIFLYSSSLYSCHLFLIFSASVRSIPFVFFIVPIFAWNVPLVSLIFLKRSLVFPNLLFPSILCTDHWGRLSYLSLLFFGTLHSDVYIFPFLLCLSLLFLSQLFVRPPQTTVLPFCIPFSWGRSWSLPPVQCHKPPSIVLQALCLWDLIHWIYLSLLLYTCRRRQWQATPVLLPEESHGWKSLVGCSPWGRYKLDAAERLHFHFSLSHSGEGNGNPLQCSCLENPGDGGAWWAAVCGTAQSQTRLKRLSSSNCVIVRDFI